LSDKMPVCLVMGVTNTCFAGRLGFISKEKTTTTHTKTIKVLVLHSTNQMTGF